MLHRIPGMIKRLGTAASKNVGTAAGQLVQLNTSAQLPAVDGSLLTNLASLPSSTLFQNLIINGGFTINHRVYVSGATLSAGTYAHDRWKAGASGGDYSFTQLVANTQITIAANKSLIQVVEDVNVGGGTHVFSWSGTAVGRVGLNSATPAGNFAASPIIVAGQTAGATISVEFTGANAAGGSALATNAGTLGTVQAALGSVVTVFQTRQRSIEVNMCLRYAHPLPNAQCIASYTSYLIPCMSLSPPMRVTPTMRANVGGTTTVGASDGSGLKTFTGFFPSALDTQCFTNCSFTGLSTNFTTGSMYFFTNTLADAEL
jgi:hypothetical protein